MARLAKIAALCAVLLSAAVHADETIYADAALASGWQDWSWGSTIAYGATDAKEGASSIAVASTAFSALSLKKDPGTFGEYAGLQFDVEGAQPDLTLTIQDSVGGGQSAGIPLSVLSKSVAGNFTTVLLDFNSIPPNGGTLGNGSWDRITWQAGANGATYHMDNIQLISTITITPEFLSAEPLANNLIAVTTAGAVDFSTVKVTLNGKTIPIASKKTIVPVDSPSKSITYLTLASSFARGSLAITAGAASFAFTLPQTLSGTINHSATHAISEHIYGVNFPTSASYIEHLGVSISRWGGNAVTAYNPFGGFTNAGFDWYFENRASDSADDWIGWVSGAGSDTLLTIPALDWVAKDNSSFSYPASVYPEQKAFDPFNAQAGDGVYANGSYVLPVPDQSSAYTPWNTSLARAWLTGLKNKPSIVTIDNEIEITSNTHQDMHPVPMGYDEELARVVNYSIMAKEALPNVKVAAPSPCSWWYYWTSQIGFTDNAAHNNTDFLPWFLAQMRAQESRAHKRLLDYLDIHYYFQPDTSANDAAAKALRLRMTRSLWDPTYVDESWVGSDPQSHQPNATIVNLIPRMRALIAQLYPGTKLSVSEWSSGADTDLTGGLLTADALGIFGRQQLDSATYWATPDETGPVGLAYWLYRGYGVLFGDTSLPIAIPALNPDTLGVYASSGAGGRTLSLVVVNKDPSAPVALALSGVPTGNYILRHFGGLAGVAKFQTTMVVKSASYIVVPAYTAVFLQQTSSL